MILLRKISIFSYAEGLLVSAALNMLVVAVLVLICSLLWLPSALFGSLGGAEHYYYVRHVSLGVESTTLAPGERPRLVGAREPRKCARGPHCQRLLTSAARDPRARPDPDAPLFGVFIYR